MANATTFLLGFGDAFEIFEEGFRRIHHPKVDIEVVAESGLHQITLIFSEQPVVDKDARQLVSDGLVQQRGHHGRIHPS